MHPGLRVNSPSRGTAPLAGLQPRTVVFHPVDGRVGARDHDTLSKRRVAARLAALMGWRFAGEAGVTAGPPGARHYVVPSDTLCSLQAAQALGIGGVDDLFGGVVPFPFVATKVITHPLIAAGAAAPAGWSHAFGADVAGAVLPGRSVFELADAQRAGQALLQGGAVRVKDPAGVGGCGQWVVRSEAELADLLARMDVRTLQTRGLVLERNLNDVVTHSVGMIRSGPLQVAYCGMQTSTRNHRGEQVYGGSELRVTRGGFADLLRLQLTPDVRCAVEQALRYHDAALAHFSGMFASRSNYDVAQGRDDQGAPCSGVLEQSWRIGGASGAEVAALEVLAGDPQLQTVRACTCERYGRPDVIPDGAWILFDGTDPRVGPLTKYALATPDGHD